MNMYFKLKANVPTKIKGGSRKVVLEIMPTHMAFYDATYNKDDDNVIVENEQGYQEGYDPKVAKELFNEIYSKATSFDYIVFFENTISGFLKAIKCEYKIL